MAAKLTRLTHKIAIQLHPVAESCTIFSSRSRRPVRKLLDTLCIGVVEVKLHEFLTSAPDLGEWSAMKLVRLIKANLNKTCSKVRTDKYLCDAFWIHPRTPKMETTRSSETLVSYHITTWSHSPEDSYLNLHRRENLKSLERN
jgi:hypothetical protein